MCCTFSNSFSYMTSEIKKKQKMSTFELFSVQAKVMDNICIQFIFFWQLCFNNYYINLIKRVHSDNNR